MNEKFSDRARKVMQLANQEAQRFNHEYIGAEHVLLGLLKEGSGVAVKVIKNLGVDLRKIRLEVEELIQPGPRMLTIGRLPLSPKANQLVKLAREVSEKFGQDYVGTEHLFVAMAHPDLRDTIAGMVLNELGLTHEKLRRSLQNVPLSININADESVKLDPVGRLNQELALGQCLSKILGQLGFDAHAQGSIATKCESDAAIARGLLTLIFARKSTDEQSVGTPLEARLGSSCFKHFLTLLTVLQLKSEVGEQRRMFEQAFSIENREEIRSFIVSLLNLEAE